VTRKLRVIEACAAAGLRAQIEDRHRPANILVDHDGIVSLVSASRASGTGLTASAR
jgi:hypothetical protein